MIKIIKNGTVYAPEYLGKKDILIVKDTIVRIAEKIPVPDSLFYEVEIIDATGKTLVPGFIDSHVHIIGGGGEGGFRTRTPEIQLSQLIKAGITTVVGCLGTDGTTRHMSSLLAKARALEEEGISAYIYTGSYQFPIQTLTGNCRDDLILIDKVIGVGEVAVADHRSSQPTAEEFARMASYARVGGLLSGKAGIVNVHLGEGRSGLQFLLDLVATSEIPIKQFLPTHVNRNKEILAEGINYVRAGGVVDLTTSLNQEDEEERAMAPGNVVSYLLAEGVPVEAITFSSDGNGSLPVFNKDGIFKELGIGSVSSLFAEVKRAVADHGLELSAALKFITVNVAERLKLEDRGRLETGKRADINILDNGLELEGVISGGRITMLDGEILVKGTYE
ncbi:MAG: beta-aspartyl-peptidase [Halanaerobiaceae bacterium]|nr:beta-aspartyl-peptidase [Halanaerobiaceae bacterium]